MNVVVIGGANSPSTAGQFSMQLWTSFEMVYLEIAPRLSNINLNTKVDAPFNLTTKINSERYRKFGENTLLITKHFKYPVFPVNIYTF